MTLSNNQAIKIATMMLQAATYDAPFMTLHPIVTNKDGRQENIQAIAKALSMLTGINAPYIIGQLIVSNGNSDMVFDELPDGVAAHLQAEYQNAPVYQDGKGRQYIMFNGVRTQDYCYQTIDVARYVDFAPTGKYRNIDALRKRIQRNSDALELDRLEDSGEIEDIDPITIQQLYK
jgi:hypothetical protein